MADKKVTPPLGAYPQPQPPQGPFLPAPPHQAAPQYGVAGGSPYGAVAFGGAGAGAGGVYAPPPYDQLQHHQAIPALSQQLPMSQMYSPAAAMYAAAAGYPGYIGYPVQYYPYYPAAVQPSIQPLRPTIMIPAEKEVFHGQRHVNVIDKRPDSYPGYIGYPEQYYSYYPAAVQPSIQPPRPTIMIPGAEQVPLYNTVVFRGQNGFEAGGRFEGLAQTLLPPAPPGVPPSPAHLAAIQPHQVLWR